jgi:5-methylcytosine-specific restriction protein B
LSPRQLVDHALHRRFAFISLYPNYDILRRYHTSTGFSVDGLIKILKQLNQEIENPHYEVGNSFFLRSNLTEQIESIWRLEIEPYLEEYFFDKSNKVNQFRWDKVKQQMLP